MKHVLFIFGTRPEAIKLAPLIKEMQKYENYFQVEVCVTAQHREMLDQVLDFFDIRPDFDLNLMKDNQFLSDLTSELIKELSIVLDKTNADHVVVQGDTTSALIGALVGFYKKKKIIYIEDGLRSGDKYSPFPEEANRSMISRLADYHFAPTKKAKDNLLNENIKNNVWVVGNTVVDALFLGLETIEKEHKDIEFKKFFNFINFSKKIILVTGHRRENFGKPLAHVCEAIKEIAAMNDVEIVYPVHLNPNVKNLVNELLGGIKNIHLIAPLEYPKLIWLMKNSFFIITDSGGIQEEAPSLHKPLLVTRDVTERIEGVKSCTAKLVGTNTQKIISEATALLVNQDKYKVMSTVPNPYGDGRACEKIINVLRKI